MVTLTNDLTTESRIPTYVRKHPITAYFFLAYAGTWLLILPLVLDNFELINLSDGATMIFFILSSIAGPNLAAFYVTGVVEGKAGMGRLFRRIFQVQAGLIWYAVALFSFLTIWLIAYSFLYSGAPIANLIANPSLLLTIFLPSVLFGLLIPSIGEEPGWRGFALPHLQKLYGPVIGTLILGTLHGFWHLPAFFTPFLGPITLNGFIAFVLTAAAGTFIYTWVFNHTRTSVWIAMVVHASSNAASKLVTELIPKDVELTGWMKVLDSGWINVIAFGITAVVLVLLTRGTLGYKPD
jgi:uncharacterized protein